MKLFKRNAKSISKNVANFISRLETAYKVEMDKPWRERNIMPVETEAQEVVNCLCDVFLGENWYVAVSMNQKQVNTVILDNILYKYCAAYRNN